MVVGYFLAVSSAVQIVATGKGQKINLKKEI